VRRCREEEARPKKLRAIWCWAGLPPYVAVRQLGAIAGDVIRLVERRRTCSCPRSIHASADIVATGVKPLGAPFIGLGAPFTGLGARARTTR
jgi:hypothetical protein